MSPLEPDECAAMARRAAALVSVTTLGRAETVAWLNVMPEPRDTGYHDHDGSAAGICVIEGSVTNEGLPLGGPRRPRHYGPGDSFSLPGSAIHRMHHDAGAITIHVYSPPLHSIGYYEIVGGLLQRTPGPPDEASPESPQLLESLAER
jgi:hypothetical protein